jgi:hypothetical protein
MTHFLLRFLAEAPLCAFWCFFWHHVSHRHKPKGSRVHLLWCIGNHERAQGKYGHKGTFEECPYPSCEGARKDNGL